MADTDTQLKYYGRLSTLCINFNHRAAAKAVPAAIAKTEHIADYAVDYQEEDFGFGTWGGIDEY